jgi:hypothetical protein
MKLSLIFLTVLSSTLFAQDEMKQSADKQLLEKQLVEKQFVIHAAGGVGAFTSTAHPVQGSPYSATVTNESVQTLADGNRIIQKTAGTTARDSQGRTRNDAQLPMIGSMSATGAPHLVFIVDPVAQASYTLNLDEKTAHVISGKMSAGHEPAGVEGATMMKTWIGAGPVMGGLSSLPPPPAGGMMVSISGQKVQLSKEQGETRTEDLGAQVIEGVHAQGVRTTRTIPAGEIGNDKPIEIVTEVWTSSELKTIVMSKRTDPRSGDQIFRLTNIVRSEPDPSLFTVPADFKTVEGGAGKNIFFYQSKE